MMIVNPNNRLRTTFAAIEPPLWAGLCAGYRNADILDAEALDLSLEDTVKAIREHGDKDIMIVVMGNNPSVSSTPKMPIAENLADCLIGFNVSMTGLHPIAVNYQNYLVITRPFQGFPMMPWDKLPMYKYRAHNWQCLDGSCRTPYASIYTSLGCPFDCYYCPIHALYGSRQVQFRPIPDIIKEVDILNQKYGVRNIKIWDELFTLDYDRVMSICSGLSNYDLNIWAYARLDSVTPTMLKIMKKAGINWLCYGFESVKDKKFTIRTEDVIKMTRDAGINILANFMFGLPGTTEEDDKASFEFALKHLFEYVNIYLARPYPGSRWYKYSKPNENWSDYDQFGNNRSPFRDKSFTEYYTNSDYLNHIRTLFGQQAVEQIQSMLQWR